MLSAHSKLDALNLYQKLNSEHPHHLLPLESSLPVELQYTSRDQYRIVLTMILSGGMSDYSLTRALKELFRRYPSFESLRNLSKAEVGTILSSVGRNDPDKTGNGARFWTLKKYYYGQWNKKITERNILKLRSPSGRGFGPKFIGTLQAYLLGNPNIFPMDGQARKALTQFGSYRYFKSDDRVRRDIEVKLARRRNEAAIDFHELLRFRMQAGLVGEGAITYQQRKIVIGWNGWRLLCAKNRKTLTPKWIYRNLVKNKQIAKELFEFVA